MAQGFDDRGHIDRAIESWGREVPDLDVDTMRTALLLGRTTGLGKRHVERALETCGLTSGEFDVLASLLHAPDRTSQPTVLARSGMLSPAGMTHRLDVLERAGLIERRHDPNDRRATLVALTEAGEAKAIEAARVHVDAEGELLGALSKSERRELTRLLETLLAAHADLAAPGSAATTDPG